jgi:hypothetical protein
MSGAVATRANRGERLDVRVALGCRQPGARNHHCSARPSARLALRQNEPHPRDDRAGHCANLELDGVVAASAHRTSHAGQSQRFVTGVGILK